MPGAARQMGQRSREADLREQLRGSQTCREREAGHKVPSKRNLRRGRPETLQGRKGINQDKRDRRDQAAPGGAGGAGDADPRRGFDGLLGGVRICDFNPVLQRVCRKTNPAKHLSRTVIFVRFCLQNEEN